MGTGGTCDVQQWQGGRCSAGVVLWMTMCLVHAPWCGPDRALCARQHLACVIMSVPEGAGSLLVAMMSVMACSSTRAGTEQGHCTAVKASPAGTTASHQEAHQACWPACMPACSRYACQLAPHLWPCSCAPGAPPWLCACHQRHARWACGSGTEAAPAAGQQRCTCCLGRCAPAQGQNVSDLDGHGSACLVVSASCALL